MKISRSIIEKYQLTPTNNHIGEAIIHNLLCFKSALPGFEDILFMECDFQGKPCKDICFYNRGAHRDGTITSEFMENTTVDAILKIIS